MVTKLVMALIAMTIAVFPANLRCITAVGSAESAVPAYRAPMTVAMSMEVLRQEENACHAHRIIPLNASWIIRTGTPFAIMPNPAIATPLAIALLVLFAKLLASNAAAAIVAHRTRFLAWIWAGSMPFPGTARHIPYLRAERAP